MPVLPAPTMYTGARLERISSPRMSKWLGDTERTCVLASASGSAD